MQDPTSAPAAPAPKPWWMGWRLVALLIVAVIVVGTARLHAHRGLEPWDAFYMTVDHHDDGRATAKSTRMSRRAALFTVFVLLTGVGSFFYAFTLFMSLLAEGDPARAAGAQAARAHAR